ncbi:MAG: 4-hydroxy-tetrahydrodipicolinate synthase [Deltaproteobacteria bacterium]|nr:4-hydroxy-tetrahydrodipicolinate synthase [Candidatus Zymogenaceae bacterium]
MFSGALTAIVTPFKKREVDFDSLADLVEFQIDQGISGLVPCGTTGESATLSHEEHHRVVEFVVKQAKGRVPVVAGAGSNSTAEAIALTIHAKEVGADAALVITPYYNKPTQEGLYLHFTTVAKEVNIPIIMYNVPGRTGVNMLPPTVARLSKVKNIVGIKEATGDLRQVSDVIEQAEKDFIVLSGDDFTVLPLIAIGGTGVISVVSNVTPRDMEEMVRRAAAGDWEEARRLHYKIMPVARAMFIETNPVPAKAALGLMGKIDPDVRLPQAPLSDASMETLKKVLKEYGLL